MNKREKQICAEIYEANKNIVYRYLKKKFSDIPEEDLLDIMQNLWTDLVKDIKKVSVRDDTARLKWLICVARMEGINWYRKNSKVFIESLDSETQMYADRIPADKVLNPVQEFVLEKLTALEILQSLTKPEREVLYASYARNPVLDGERNFTNAERCRNYRMKKKLKEAFKKGE